MSIERSHGKARPTLPRASALQPLGSAPDRSDGRTPDGRFAPGNRASVGSGFRRTTKKLLGPTGADSSQERIVRRDAWRVFVATMRTMPSDAAPVRTLIGLHARHVALAALYAQLASEATLGSAASLKLQEAADRQSQLATRVLVTALDAARVCAQRDAAGKPSALERLLSPGVVE